MARLIVLNGPPGVGKVDCRGAVRRRAPRDASSATSTCSAPSSASGRPTTPAPAPGSDPPALGDDRGVPAPQRRRRPPPAPGTRAGLDKFVGAATDAGAEVVEVLLTADKETCVRRFAARDLASPHARASRAPSTPPGVTASCGSTTAPSRPWCPPAVDARGRGSRGRSGRHVRRSSGSGDVATVSAPTTVAGSPLHRPPASRPGQQGHALHVVGHREQSMGHLSVIADPLRTAAPTAEVALTCGDAFGRPCGQ